MDLSPIGAFQPNSFIFERPLYSPLIATAESGYFGVLMNFNQKIEGYSISLKSSTTYIITNSKRNNYNYTTEEDEFLGISSFTLTCLRTSDLIVVYVLSSRFEVEDKEGVESVFYQIQKIGQYPSIADMHISQIRAYDKILDKEKLKEFTKGIGLAAHGVGIGSFVYLRRIIEYLIEEAHKIAKVDPTWIEGADYEKKRTSEKIQSLKNYLPQFLVENKEVYGILSKGIHELDEDECLKYFEVLKFAIEAILDEKLEEREKKLKREAAQKAISNLAKKI